MKRVINFSGGKTSAYMTLLVYKPGDIVLFTDTGREHPKTYKFINDFEAYENIPVIRISYMGSARPFDALLLKKKYKKIPNRMKRICTVELKINTAKRYLRSIGVTKFENFIGFRADEKRRVESRKVFYKKVFDKFPLYNHGITKDVINNFWETKPYNLEIPPILGNCTLCFMKGKNAIISILSQYPELAEPWIEDERLSAIGLTDVVSGRRYFADVTIQQLLDIAQNGIKKEYSLEALKPAFDCACTT